MAIVSGDSKENFKNDITILLDSFDDWCHCRAIQPKLGCILIKAKIVQRKEVRVGLDNSGVELLQGQPCSGQGWTGGQKGLHCSFMGQISSPAIWKGAQTSPVYMHVLGVFSEQGERIVLIPFALC